MNILSKEARQGMAVLAPWMMTITLLAGCSSMGNSNPPPANTDTMTEAEMRLDQAGGPAKAATPKGIVSPVATPSAPGKKALTSAGANTPLGKEWIFTSVSGFSGVLPPAPTNASMLMTRESGRMVGTTSCNQMSAAFTIDPVAATLSFQTITNGQAMCGEPNSDVEDAVINALNNTDSFLMNGNTLTLISNGKPVATLTAP